MILNLSNFNYRIKKFLIPGTEIRVFNQFVQPQQILYNC